MKKRFLSIFLIFALCLTLSPAVLAAEPEFNWDGLPSEDAARTVCDTGRGYIVYYFFASSIYYSEDGMTWTDLSDRPWVQEARIYTQLFVGGLGHREFQFIWTGTEYMMRQSLLDDPRTTHQRYGDSPRNNTVTFLDEDFQIIGKMAFDGAVSDIRYEDGTYYATVGGVEIAFSRKEWLAGELNKAEPIEPPEEEFDGFSDVHDTDWFAPYVDVCVEEGLMNGVGGGLFAPEQNISATETIVLALRLHDLAQGGNGTFETAPAEWGYATLCFPDGTVHEGYVNDEAVWERRRVSLAGTRFGFALDTDEERAWGLSMDCQTAPLTLSGETYNVQLNLLWVQDQPVFLHIGLDENVVDDHAARWDALNTALNRVFDAPTPQDWWRDAWYYAYENGLGNQHDGTSAGDPLMLAAANDDRGAFAERIAAVIDLPVINDIDTLPDTGKPAALELYRSGVLTGMDAYGTFDSAKTLTRAEAAAICARVLRPELRIEFTPQPLETYEPYTLTLLREEEVWWPYRSEDLLIIDDYTLLRLDGVEFAAPEGYHFVSVGDGLAELMYYHQDVYFDSTRRGIMDAQGQFREATYEEAANLRLPGHPDTQELRNGYQGGANSEAFYNAQGQQVTPSFSWRSVVNAQGQGFVGLNGKIYRIQFERTENN